MGKRIDLIAVTLAIGGLLPTAAHAQDSQSPAAEPDINEVVVTAQKRTEKLLDVPISITALSGRNLEQTGITDVTNLGQVVPGLRIDSSGPNSEPTIRGVTTTSSGVSISANIATYVDGFYRPSELATAFDFVDVSSVQVLKGPQGTLFGRNATGGAILITTADPTFDTNGVVKLSYGNYNDTRVQAAGSTGITGNLATSVALYGRTTDGFSHDILTSERLGDIKTWSVRNKWLFKPVDAVELLFTFEHSDVDDPSSAFVNVYNGESSGASVPGTVIPTQRRQISSDVTGAGRFISNAGLLRSKFDLGWGTLTSYSGYQQTNSVDQQFDLDGTRAEVQSAYYPSLDKVVSQEFNLASEGNERLNWVTGLYFMHAYGDIALHVPYNFNLIHATYSNTAYAAFADATYGITPDWFLTAGVRVGQDEVKGSYEALFAPISGNPEHTFGSATPRGVLRYQLNPESNVYASYSQGYKAGVFNLSGLSSTPVKPEKISAYEVGYKAAQRRWQLEAAAFYYHYTDLQVSSFIGNTTQLLNAAQARIYGADGHLGIELTDTLHLDLGGAYVHGRYTEFPGAPNFQFSPTTGLVTSVPGDAAGNQLIHTPTFNGNITADYHRTVWNGVMHLNANYGYSTKVPFDAYGNFVQKGFGILNLRASWTTPSDKWTFALYSRNATDTKYITEVVPAQGILQQWGTPVTYGFELSTKL